MILYMYFSYIIVGSDYPTSRYWDVAEGEPFPTPNEDESDSNNPLFYLKRALGWLDELDMKGLIDLHAAPGYFRSRIKQSLARSLF